MSYSKIIINGREFSISGKTGLNILKKYIRYYLSKTTGSTGGSTSSICKDCKCKCKCKNCKCKCKCKNCKCKDCKCKNCKCKDCNKCKDCDCDCTCKKCNC